MNWKLLLAACVAAFGISTARAEISSMVVRMTPATAQYDAGEQVRVTAVGNGVKRQTAFALDRITLVGESPVRQQFWSSLTSFNIDTTGLPAGEYRLTVQAREAGKREVLSKVQYFRIAAPAAVSACDWIQGATFANATSGPLGVNLGCPGGFLCLGLLNTLTSGFNLTTAANAANLSSIGFANGQVSIMPAGVSVFTTLGNGYVQASSALTGSYTCSGNTVTFSTSGSGLLSGAGSLVSLLNGSTVPFTISGSLTVDPVAGTVTGGATAFR